jgi:Domain of unknown function (DUF4397)
MLTPSRIVPRMTAVVVLGGGLLGLSATSVAAAPADGYVRLAHLSPDTPAVDVYLYASGSKKLRLVLRHVTYGTLSPYQRLGAGSYEVAMRPADAAAASPPVLSTDVRVRDGQSYTVAGMGPYKAIKLRILRDTVALPAGRAGLRVIQASLRDPTVHITTAGHLFANALRFPATTAYRSESGHGTAITVTSASGAPASTRIPMTTGSVYTVVVLDGKNGLELMDVHDTTQDAKTPRGGVDTGLGGLSRTVANTPGTADGRLLPAAGLAGVAAVIGFGLAGVRRLRHHA